MNTWYDVLQVNRTASKEVIEMAYKALAKQYHPDLNPAEYREQAEENMKILNQAREILTNDDLRTQYDEYLKEQEMDSTYYSVDTNPQKIEEDQEELFKFLKKWPLWLRWILCLPAFVIGYTIVFYIAYFSYRYTIGFIDKNDIVWFIIGQPTGILGGFVFFNAFVPKYKFIATLVISIILGALIVLALYSVILYWQSYTLLYFMQCLLSDLLTFILAIYFCVISFKSEYR